MNTESQGCSKRLKKMVSNWSQEIRNAQKTQELSDTIKRK